MSELTRVELGGILGRKFGKVHHYAVETPAEAIRALSANFAGFRAHMLTHSKPGYTIYVDGKDRSIEEISLYPNPRTIRIVPLTAGGAKSPGTQILMGVLIIAATVFLTPAGGYAVGSFGAYASAAAMGIGASMTLGGIAQLIAGDPALTSNAMASSEDKPVWAYDGPQNVTAQGVPVPVVYGMMEVGSVVGSFGFYAEEFATEDVNLGVGFRINAVGESYTILLDGLGLPTETTKTISTPFSSSSGTAPITWELTDRTVGAVSANLRIFGTNVISDAFAIPTTFSAMLRAVDSTGQVAEKSLVFDYALARPGPQDPTLTTGGA